MPNELDSNYNPNAEPDDELEYKYQQEGQKFEDYSEKVSDLPRYNQPTLMDGVLAPLWGIDRSLVGGVGKLALDSAAEGVELYQKGRDKVLDSVGLGEVGKMYREKQGSLLAETGYFPGLLRGVGRKLKEAVDYTPPNYNSADRLLMWGGEMYGDVLQFQAAGGENILNESRMINQTLKGENVAKSVSSGRLFEGQVDYAQKYVGDKLYNLLKLPAYKLGDKAALRGLGAFSRAAGEVAVNTGLNAAKVASFEMFSHAANNYDALITGEEPEDPSTTAMDVVWAGVFGAGLHSASKLITLGGIRGTSAGLNYVFGKGKDKGSVKIMDALEMRNMGEAAHGGWISRGYDDLKSLLKGNINKVRRKIAKNPDIKEKLGKHSRDLGTEIEDLSVSRGTSIESLKKFSKEDWEKVPASVFKKFERYMDEQKHLNDDGAHKYEWWDEYRKQLGDLKLPAHGDWAKLTKWHKEGQVSISKMSKELEGEASEPLSTHASELNAIEKSLGEKKKLSQKNIDLLEKRKSNLSSVDESHELTKVLDSINEKTDQIEDNILKRRTADTLLKSPEFGPEDKQAAEEFTSAYSNEPPRDVDPTAKQDFKEETQEDDKQTEKKLMSEAEVTELSSLPDEIKNEAKAEIKKLNEIETNHPSIKKLMDKVITCITGANDG